jgi:hypothetical protein
LSKDIIASLTADPEKPWVEFSGSDKGKPITPKQLAGLLKGFGIISGTVHPEGKADGKGYNRIDFDDVFSRYSRESGYAAVLPS